MRGLSVGVAGIAASVAMLTGCAGNAGYPHQPKINATASFHDRTLAVQQWANDSCFYNPAGVAGLEGLDPTKATYGQFGDALDRWFEDNVPDAANVPAGHSYYVAVTTGCYAGLDKLNH